MNIDIILKTLSSPSYEGVDWNFFGQSHELTEQVLPLTREWIEIYNQFLSDNKVDSSPSYEGVDWNFFVELSALGTTRSPSYEGVDWNFWHSIESISRKTSSPSYEGVDWNLNNLPAYQFTKNVLPLTREWIEIDKVGLICEEFIPFSLLRGSGLKFAASEIVFHISVFSLLRGSGLK